ncbi:MAG: hypothetical protein DRQ10_04255 [Candidatus Hydrothermota bacterium]|nr:MAG: hypothetical protein DRQ10_04255 [Candidatus Hydrothermae bacterium]
MAKVLVFDENLGRGIIRLLDTGERIRITHKDIDEDGFKILFEGEVVEVYRSKDGSLKIRRINNLT